MTIVTMTIVTDSIAADIATLSRVVAVPTGALGYGTDLSCEMDLTSTIAEVDPFSVAAIGEAVVRRLSTPRGRLVDAPDYGFDIRGMLNRGTPVAQLQSLNDPIRSEVEKDDRIDSALVNASYLDQATLRVEITITAADPALGVFTLTLAVTDGAVLAETIT
jgi:hypothetical protein